MTILLSHIDLIDKANLIKQIESKEVEFILKYASTDSIKHSLFDAKIEEFMERGYISISQVKNCTSYKGENK